MKLSKRKSNKGITLIALIVTIIVLLILAAITIGAITGKDGIINQANDAKEQTEIAEEKEVLGIATVNAMGKNEEGLVTKTNLDGELDKNPGKTGYSSKEVQNGIQVTFTDSKRSYIVDVNGNITEDSPAKPGEIVTGGNKTYENNGTAVIPDGWAIVPGLDNVGEGLVISDMPNDTNDEGNQFVWVPVEDFSQFKREHFGYSGESAFGEFISSDSQSSDNTLYEPKGNGISSGTEVEKMYKSVRDNKGFYIGRYKTGLDEKGNIVVKNNLSSGFKTGEETITLARNFAKENNYSSLTSTLCYGVQWDAVLRWVKDTLEPEDKNIYGMKGIAEMTMERMGGANGPFIYRGYHSSASFRDFMGNATGYIVESDDLGFRITMFL